MRYDASTKTMYASRNDDFFDIFHFNLELEDEGNIVDWLEFE